MLFKTSQNQRKIAEELTEISGNSYTIFEMIKKDIYGSPKYKIIAISKNKFDLNFEQDEELIYCTIELRKRGLGLYFRHRNEEYILASRFNQFSFLTNDGIFEIQMDSIQLKLKITDAKRHKKLLQRLMKCRSEIS